MDADISTDPDYAFWRDTLAGKKPQIHVDEPQAGFYSRSQKGDVAQPVAIWREGEGLPLTGGIGFPGDNGGYARAMSPRDVLEAWPWVAGRAIPEERYWKAMDAGKWPDGLPEGVVGAKESQSNSEGLDPAVAKGEEIDNALAGLDRAKKIESDEQLAAAQSLRSRLLELKRDAEAAHKGEKQPITEQGRAIDQKWLPLSRKAEAGANTLRTAMEDYNDAKRKAAQKAEAERVAAEKERLRLEAEQQPADSPAPVAEVEEAQPVPATPPPATKVRGGYGRAASGKTVKVVKAITDQDALYQFFRHRSEVAELLTILADRALKGESVDVIPGIEIEEKTRYS